MTRDDLRTWRKVRELTQPEAAAVLGLSLRGYQDQEGGRRAVSRQTTLLIRVLDMLDAAQLAELRRQLATDQQSS